MASDNELLTNVNVPTEIDSSPVKTVRKRKSYRQYLGDILSKPENADVPRRTLSRWVHAPVEGERVGVHGRPVHDAHNDNTCNSAHDTDESDVDVMYAEVDLQPNKHSTSHARFGDPDNAIGEPSTDEESSAKRPKSSAAVEIAEDPCCPGKSNDGTVETPPEARPSRTRTPPLSRETHRNE